jgi:hypothetical protein
LVCNPQSVKRKRQWWLRLLLLRRISLPLLSIM